jgi:hypothetical protein
MDIFHWFLLGALCLQWFVTGTIWYAQTTVYPLFARVGPTEYVSYHSYYASSILLSVIVPGFLSFMTPIGLLVSAPDDLPGWLLWINVAAGIVGFLVTVLLAIPRHNRLERDGKDDRLIAELVRYNWPRTASLTVSCICTTAMLFHAFVPV